MNDREKTLVIELLVNHLVHLRTQVEILQEKLDQQGVVQADSVERALESTWNDSGKESVEAFWDEIDKLKSEPD